MNNQNENDNRTIQFGNSINPNSNSNANQPNMNLQNGTIQNSPNYNQQPMINNQQVGNPTNVNPTYNPSYEQQNVVNNNIQQENINNNVNSSVNYNNSENTPKKSNTKLIIIIVIAVVALFGLIRVVGLILAQQGITSVLDNTRTSAFVSDAKSYLESARSLVLSDATNSLLGGSIKYAPSCFDASKKVSKITFNDISSNTSGISTVSPFGESYDLNSSYVQVVADLKNNECKYIYSIYITDGTYSIGSPSSPVEYDKLSVSDVKK